MVDSDSEDELEIVEVPQVPSAFEKVAPVPLLQLPFPVQSLPGKALACIATHLNIVQWSQVAAVSRGSLRVRAYQPAGPAAATRSAPTRAKPSRNARKARGAAPQALPTDSRQKPSKVPSGLKIVKVPCSRQQLAQVPSVSDGLEKIVKVLRVPDSRQKLVDGPQVSDSHQIPVKAVPSVSNKGQVPVEAVPSVSNKGEKIVCVLQVPDSHQMLVEVPQVHSSRQKPAKVPSVPEPQVLNSCYDYLGTFPRPGQPQMPSVSNEGERIVNVPQVPDSRHKLVKVPQEVDSRQKPVKMPSVSDVWKRIDHMPQSEGELLQLVCSSVFAEFLDQNRSSELDLLD